MAQDRKFSPKLIAAAGTGQLLIGYLTVRDINRRESSQIRGPRLIWRVWGATNTAGSLAYWTIGRRK